MCCFNSIEKKISKLEKKIEKIVQIKMKIKLNIDNLQEDLKNLELVESKIQEQLTKLRIELD